MMAFATKPKTTVRRTKRTGSHHKQNQKYLKHYWPYLPMAAIVSLGLLGNVLWTQRTAVLGANSVMTSSSLLAETNVARTSEHLSTLAANHTLAEAAQTKAQDMVTKNYWSHDTPDGVTPWHFISSAGYKYQTAGENLAYGFGDSQQVVTAWLNSPEHRANVLGETYTQVGFGIAKSDDYLGHGAATVVVAMYARPSTTVTLAAVPKTGSASQAVKGTSTSQSSVSRFAVMNPSLQSISVVIVLACVGLLLYVFTRHSLAWHRVLVKGERFALAHPMLDVIIISVVMAGLLISKSAGFIL